MIRLSNGTQVASLPAPLAVSGTPGFAGRGSLIDGVLPSILDADIFNRIQEELVAPILAAGLTLSGSDNTQLLQAIRLLVIGSFTGGVTANGIWRILPDGFVEQWGSVPAGSVNNVAVTFPIPFPSGLTPTDLQATTANSTGSGNGASVYGQSSTGMAVAMSAPYSFWWSAKGK